MADTKEDAAQSLEKLRRTILGPDRARIDRLEDRPPVSADSVGAVMPEAIADATSKRERQLAVALEPTVTEAVTSVARRRPELYAEALAPTIGAAVRKAVADMLAVVMERFNAALERSLTLRSIQWRIEAARTGRPFAEVALLHTLVYRVEQVFLIHTRTSLVLQHLVDPALLQPGSDQVAAMLSAIESFGREALGPMPSEAHLDRFSFGDLTVWIGHDPSLTLAAVVRGAPSASITEMLDEALSRVRLRCTHALREFAGDIAAFETARPMLEPLLRIERRKPARRAEVVVKAAAIAVGALLIVLTAWGVARRVVHARLANAYLAALQTEPGIVVNGVRWNRYGARLEGLRDPLAASPEKVLAENGLPPASFELAPFVSLDPRMVARRAENALQPPRNVRMDVEGQSLRLTGTAPRAWIDEARLLGRVLPGVERIDDHALRPEEGLDALRAAASQLDALAIAFAPGQSAVEPGQRPALRRAADLARSGLEAAADARVGACLVMTGHTDPTGTAERNVQLSADRATTVLAQLTSMGVEPRDARAVGAGVSPSETPSPRSVTFHLDIDDSRLLPGCGGPP